MPTQERIKTMLDEAEQTGALSVSIMLDSGEFQIYDVKTRRLIPPEEAEQYTERINNQMKEEIIKDLTEKRYREEWGEDYEWLKQRGAFVEDGIHPE